MGFMDKLKEFVAPIDEEDVNDNTMMMADAPAAATVQPQTVDTTAAAAAAAPVQPAQSTYERPKANTQAPLSPDTKMVLFEPRSYGEAEDAGARLREGRAVVINLHKVNRAGGQRILDFLAGVVFTLNGNMQQIGQNVVLCYPSEIGVSGTISLSQDEGISGPVE